MKRAGVAAQQGRPVGSRLAAEETPLAYRDGTTHVLFEPLDFIAGLAALVPPPRLNLTRFHGVFAPNSRYRARCPDCGADFLVAFSCKGRGACTSCATKRKAATAAHLSESVIPRVPMRQWVLSMPNACARRCARTRA